AQAPPSTAASPAVPWTPAPGAALPTAEWDLTPERVRAYADAAGDHNAIHLDEAFARRSPFGRRIAHGMLLMAYMAAVLEAACGAPIRTRPTLAVRFRAAAPVDAPVVVGGQVERVDAATGLIECSLWCRSPEGVTFVEGTASDVAVERG